MLDQAAKWENWAECVSCFKWRLLPPGALKVQESTKFFCSQVGEACEISKKKRGKAPAGRR